MPSVQGILRHLEVTYFGTAAIPLGDLAACLHFPRYMLFFSLDVVAGEKRRVIYSRPGFAGWLAALYGSPSCAATRSKNQEEVQRFSVRHTVNVLQDQHLLEASDLLWRCCAAAYVCVMDQHLSSVTDLLSVYKPSAQKIHKEKHQPHTGWQWSCLPTGEDGSRVGVALERGRAFPDGHHISGVTGLFVPTWMLQHGTICAASQIWVWFGFAHVAVCVLCIHLNNRNKACDPRSG